VIEVFRKLGQIVTDLLALGIEILQVFDSNLAAMVTTRSGVIEKGSMEHGILPGRWEP
jgi:hypothetical protein